MNRVTLGISIGSVLLIIIVILVVVLVRRMNNDTNNNTYDNTDDNNDNTYDDTNTLTFTTSHTITDYNGWTPDRQDTPAGGVSKHRITLRIGDVNAINQQPNPITTSDPQLGDLAFVGRPLSSLPANTHWAQVDVTQAKELITLDAAPAEALDRTGPIGADSTYYQQGGRLRISIANLAEAKRYTRSYLDSMNISGVESLEDEALAVESSEGVPKYNSTCVINLNMPPGTFYHTVTVVPNPYGLGRVYKIDDVIKPVLTLIKGSTYEFDVSHTSNSSHPFAFSDSDGNMFTTGVTTVSTGGQQDGKVIITVPTSGTQPNQYFCQIHSNMGNLIATFTATQLELTDDDTKLVPDLYGGHPQPCQDDSIYHVHHWPAGEPDPGTQEYPFKNKVVGYAFDGLPIMGQGTEIYPWTSWSNGRY